MAIKSIWSTTGVNTTPSQAKPSGVKSIWSDYKPPAQVQPTVTPTVAPIAKPIAQDKPLIAKVKNAWSSLSNAVGTAMDVFIKKPIISPIPPVEKKPTPVQQGIKKATQFVKTSVLPFSEERIQKEKDWLVKNYDSQVTKALVTIQQLAEDDFKKRPETFGFTKGVTQLAIGGTKSFSDYYNQEKFIPDNPLGKARMAYGEVAEGLAELWIGGSQLRAMNGIKQLLPVMFATIGQLKASDKTTIEQRLAMIPKDLLTGWLFTKIPMSDKLLSPKTGVGALATGAVNYASAVTSKLIEGMDAKTALKTSYASFIIGSLFHVAGVGFQQLTGAKFMDKDKTFTPDEVMDRASKIQDPKTQGELMKIAIEAQRQGKDIKISVVAAKESPAARVVGKGVVENLTGQPQEITLADGKKVSGITTVEFVEPGAKIGARQQQTREIIKIDKTKYTGLETATAVVRPDGTGSMFVVFKPEAQKQGQGTQLVKDIEQQFSDRGVTNIEIKAFNEAIGFWEKQGYEKTGAPSDRKDLITMQKTLSQEQQIIDKNKSLNIENAQEAREKTLAGEQEAQRLDNEDQLAIAKSYTANGLSEDATANTLVTVYRAGTDTETKDGDFVTLDRANAERYVTQREGSKVMTAQVPLRDLVFSGGLKSEFFYAPKRVKEGEVAKVRQNIPDLDAEIRTITKPTKENPDWVVEIGLQESLGEQGGDIVTWNYTAEPTLEEIRKDILDEYKRVKAEINEEVVPGITSKSGRDDMIEGAIDKVLSASKQSIIDKNGRVVGGKDFKTQFQKTASLEQVTFEYPRGKAKELGLGNQMGKGDYYSITPEGTEHYSNDPYATGVETAYLKDNARIYVEEGLSSKPKAYLDALRKKYDGIYDPLEGKNGVPSTGLVIFNSEVVSDEPISPSGEVAKDRVEEDKSIITDAEEVLRIQGSIKEGELLLSSNKNTLGETLDPDEREMIQRSIDNARRKIGEGITLAPSQAKTPDEQVAEALAIGLPQSLKNVFHGESGQRGTGYRKPTMTKTDIKMLLDNMSEFKENPILTVNKDKDLIFSGKTSNFLIHPEALQINPDRLRVGQKIKVDIQAIKKAPGVQQMRAYEGGTAFASIGDYAILKNMTTDDTKRPDMPSYKTVPFPELVRIVKELTGKSPQVVKRMGQALGRAYAGTLDIKLATKIFSDPDTAARVIAHELGHIEDYLPDGGKRTGNLLGRIASLNGYLKHFLAEFPGGLNNTLTAKDKARLKAEAKKLAQIPVQETQEVIVSEKLPEPKEILDIWRTNTSSIDNPELLAYIQKLSSELKADIVKAALKSQIPKWVTFKKQIKETITSGVIRNAPEDIQRLYKKLLEEEIIKRRLLSLETIRQELQALSAEWRPFDRIKSSPHYVEYRDKPSELYADAISVLYNDPERLKATAPEFYRGYFNYLDQKPEVAEAYAAIQDLINGGTEEVNKARLEDLYEGFEEGAKKRRELIDQKIKDKPFWFKFVTNHVAKFHPAYNKLKQLVKEKKITMSDAQILRSTLEEMEMNQNDIWMDLTANEREVSQPLKNAGISENELGAWFTLERNLNDRKGLANPGGLIDNYAQELKDFLEKGFTPVQQEVLKDVVKKFHDRTFAIFEEMYKEGMIGEKVWKEKIEPFKDTYVTYGVVKYIDKNYVNPLVKNMTGTLEAIENPYVTTMFKRSSAIQSIAVQKGKVGIRDMLKTYFPDEIAESTSVLAMNLQKIYRETPGKGQLKLLENGKHVAYDVDPYFEEMFKRFEPRDIHSLVQIVGKFNRYFKPVVTTYKLGWALWNNPLRDLQRSLRNIHAISKSEGLKFNPIEFLATWITTIPEGYKFGGGELSQLAEAAVKSRAISKPFVSYDPTGGEDRALAALYEKFHFLSSGDKLTKAGKIRKLLLTPIEMVLKALERTGATFESNTKLAGFKYLSKKIADEKKVALYIRNYIGTPNYVDGGRFKQTDNSLLVFSNVIIQSMRSDLELIANPKSRGAYVTEVILQDGIWKILMLAMAGGLLGKKLKDMYKKITEYNKTNYITFPIYELPSGKVLSFSIPQDEANRLAGAMIWKAGTAMQGQLKKPGQLVDVGAGVFPTASPIFDIVNAWFDYARGLNPYDSFYGQNVMDQQTAQIRGLEGLKEMSLWTLNQMGLGNFATYDASNDTTFEKIIRFTPLINRMFKVTDYGAVEEAREIQRLDQQERAIQNKKEADLVEKYAKEFTKKGGNESDYLERIIDALYPEGIQTKEEKQNINRLKKDFTDAVAGKTEDTRFKTIMNLQLNTSKVKTLQGYKQEMSPEAYADLLSRLYEDKMISKDVYREVE